MCRKEKEKDRRREQDGVFKSTLEGGDLAKVKLKCWVICDVPIPAKLGIFILLPIHNQPLYFLITRKFITTQKASGLVGKGKVRASNCRGMPLDHQCGCSIQAPCKIKRGQSPRMSSSPKGRIFFCDFFFPE